jgi:hypothetical protein
VLRMLGLSRKEELHIAMVLGFEWLSICLRGWRWGLGGVVSEGSMC